MNLEVLCVTMNQNSFMKYKEMNIQSDVIFANQCNENNYKESVIEGNTVRMISTNSIGVGLNRNIAFAYSKGDILLLCDDDFVFSDGYKDQVIEAFVDNPEADIISFGINYSKKGAVFKTSLEEKRRRKMYNSLHYGASRLAIKKQSFLKGSLFFSELFGGGSLFCSGEDSIFIVDALRKKMRIISYPFILGTTNKDSSSWFKGYDEKYFYDDGAFIQRCGGLLKYILILRHSFDRRKQGISIMRKIVCILSGMRGYKKLLSYSEWEKMRKK